jgi:hypothetical protein
MPQLQAGRHASHDAPDFLDFGLSLGGEPLAVAPVLLFETKTPPEQIGSLDFCHKHGQAPGVSLCIENGKRCREGRSMKLSATVKEAVADAEIDISQKERHRSASSPFPTSNTPRRRLPRAASGGIDKLAPHDLRRTCARLCPLAGGELD